MRKKSAHHGAVSQHLPCNNVLASLPCNCLLTKCHAAKVLPSHMIHANCHATLCWQASHGRCQAPCSNMDAVTELCNSHWPAPAQITPPALWTCDKMLLPETTVPSCQRSAIRQLMVDLLHLPTRDLLWGKCLFHTLTTVSTHAKHAEVQP